MSSPLSGYITPRQLVLYMMNTHMEIYENIHIYFFFPVLFILKVKLNTTSFGDQFDYLKKKVTEATRKPQTPCNYGDMVC